MNRVIVWLMLCGLLMSMVPSAAAAPSHIDCGEVKTYMEKIDALAGEAFLKVVSDPEWAPTVMKEQLTLQTLIEGGNVHNPEEPNALLNFIAIPLDVLDRVDSDDVPESMLALHTSATEYWVISTDLVEALYTEGQDGAMAFLEPLEKVTTENLEAQRQVRTDCAENLTPFQEREEQLQDMFAVLEMGGDISTLTNADAEDMQGFAYFILFFANEPVQSPARVTVPVRATPED